MNQVLVILAVLLLSGCFATIPHDLQTGLSISEFKDKIQASSEEVNIPNPENSNEKFKVLEYSSLLPPDHTGQPKDYWFLFYNDKFVTYGLGTAKNAEFTVYRAYLDTQVSSKQIKHSEKVRLLYQKYNELYGSNSIVDEMFAHAIMVNKEWEDGKISQEEATYRIMQKQAEIDNRLSMAYYQQEQLRTQRMQNGLLIGLDIQGQQQMQLQQQQIELQRRQMNQPVIIPRR